MKTLYIYFFSFLLFAVSCKNGSLHTICNLKKSLKESSALEKISTSDLLWTIEDSNNKNILYGINANGKIIKKINFGNNNGKRNKFQIYKIPHTFTKSNTINAEIIEFKLPKKSKTKDFEAFFLLKNNFYVFSKENGKSSVFKIPNQTGIHKAKLVDNFNLKGKNNQITAADISNNRKTIILLNHDKIWKIDNFNGDDFFDGDIESIPLNHKSQKEGVCFKNKNTLYISDERTHKETGNIYEFSF